MTARCKKCVLAILACTAAVGAILVTTVVAVNAYVVRNAKPFILTSDDVSSDYEAIVVLGAGLRADGTPSDMLADRLDTAVALYQKGVAPVLFLTGDRSGEEYDEVGSMARYCMERGVSAQALVCDAQGFSTYESMENVRAYGYSRFLVVTQQYHLYRAIYIAERMGAQTEGVSADLHTYRGQAFREIREYVARVKDWTLVSFLLMES